MVFQAYKRLEFAQLIKTIKSEGSELTSTNHHKGTNTCQKIRLFTCNQQNKGTETKIHRNITKSIEVCP